MTPHPILPAGRRRTQPRHLPGRSPLLLLLAVWTTAVARPAQAAPADRWWSDAAEQALTRAGTNRAELVQALHQAPVSQRDGLQFLVENMPRRDLETLSAAFLLENLALAFKAREEVPWSNSVPAEIFLNEVLPYANMSEPRDPWRKRLRELCVPLVTECRTPAEAAQQLNRKLFRLVKVRYSTQRRRAVQSPIETMESGLATCTGLSILLVDACRSVGVPARVVGTPLWSNKTGNHTWVEIWDGDWHFTGAAEPDPKGLDRGWFVHNASQARKDVPEHAIYALSFRKTGLAFPAFWGRDTDPLSAVNVTDRYLTRAKPAHPGTMRLLVKVLDRPAGERVAAKVTVTDTADRAVRFEGTSRGETADLNDVLPFEVPRQRMYLIEVSQAGRTNRQSFIAGTNAQDQVVVFLDAASPLTSGEAGGVK